MNAVRIFALAALVGLAPAADLHRVEIKEIKSTIQQTPQFEVSGIDDKAFDPRYWLEIEAELEVETVDPTGFIPELQTKWFAAVRAIDDSDPNGKKRKTLILTGEVTFRNIRAKDGEAHVIAFIEPDVLERLTGEKRPREDDLEALALVVSGPRIASDKKHAAGLEMATAMEKDGWWKRSMFETMADAVVAKSKTPFAPLWSDRYPTEKPE